MNSQTPLSQWVFSVLKDDVITRRLPPGTPLSEKPLASRFGTSKTPVREAMRRLAQEGYVESIPRKGYFVTQPSVEMVRELLELRLILESAAAGLAAERGPTSALDQIRALVQLSNTNQTGEAMKSFNERNSQFHQAIATATGNKQLVEAIGVILERLQQSLYFDLRNETEEKLSQEHHSILEALKARDPARARDLMAQHIQGTTRRLLL